MLDLKNRVSTFLKSEYDPLIPLRVLAVKTVDVKPSRRNNPIFLSIAIRTLVSPYSPLTIPV